MREKIIVLSALIIVLIAAVCVISHIFTRILLNVALDRKEYRFITLIKEKIMGSSSLAGFTAELRRAEKELVARNLKEIHIVAEDGVELVAHWRPVEGARRVVVAMHGWRSTWAQDFGIVSDFMYENGCSVLYAEERGQNNSGGEYMGFGMLERYDCLEWIKWVNAETEAKLPVYLAGISMGASTVLMTAAFELPQNVCGIIADCGFTSAHDIWKHVLESNLHLSYRLRRATVNHFCKKKIKYVDDGCSAVEALKSSKVPVLFIHGTDDGFVPIWMTYENYKACSAPKHLFVVPGANHGMSCYVDREGYEKNVKAFWQEYDEASVGEIFENH